jgi:hypothetical protein
MRFYDLKYGIGVLSNFGWVYSPKTKILVTSVKLLGGIGTLKLKQLQVKAPISLFKSCTKTAADMQFLTRGSLYPDW